MATVGHESDDLADELLTDPRSLANDSASGETSREEYAARVLAGGFPLPLMLPAASRGQWFADYVALVCQRDVLALTKVRQREQLPRLLTRLASQTGQVLNLSEAARSVEVENSSAENYAQLLEAVFLVNRLPPWGTTRHARIITTSG